MPGFGSRSNHRVSLKSGKTRTQYTLAVARANRRRQVGSRRIGPLVAKWTMSLDRGVQTRQRCLSRCFTQRSRRRHRLAASFRSGREPAGGSRAAFGSPRPRCAADVSKMPLPVYRCWFRGSSAQGEMARVDLGCGCRVLGGVPDVRLGDEVGSAGSPGFRHAGV
jgi:hypothetical protein